MAKKNLNIKVDTINSLNKPEGIIKQLDSVFFNVEITEAGEKKDLTSQQVKLFAKKSDGKIVEQTTGISITDATNGQLTIDLLNAAVQVAGYVYFELEIFDNSGTISTANFIYRVVSKVGSDEAIESTNEVATLKKIEEYVAQAKVELQKFKELQTEMLNTNETINNQENLRVKAELKRVEAESLRVTAETKREEAFNKFEGRITANAEELKTARTATTGEDFNTLDERIDCEVNRINKKIEISFLQQEDKESHAIENTVKGMSTSMIVKGRTLNNLLPKQTVTLNSSNSSKFFQILPINANTDFILSVNITAKKAPKNGLRCGFKKNDGSWVYSDFTTGVGTQIKKFNLEHNIEAITFYIPSDEFVNTPDANITFIEPMAYIGNIKSSYFEGVKSFGEEENNEITTLIRSENLFNNNSYYLSQNGATAKKTLTGIEVYNSEPTAWTCAIFKVKVPKNKNLYINYSTDGSIGDPLVVIRDLNNKDLYTFNTTGGTFNTGENDEINILFHCSKEDVKHTSVTYSNLIISEDDIQRYIEYKENKKNILLEKYGFNEGLRGLKTTYDELNSISNMAIKRIGKYTFTGDENWVLGLQSGGWGEFNDTLVFYITEFNQMSKCTEIICNRLPNINVIKTNVEGICNNVYSSKAHPVIRIKKSKLSSQNLEGFKKWLKENQTVIYYELAEPIKTSLVENINSKIFNEKTYIDFENALRGTNSFKVPVNTLATISRLNKENRALEEENLKFKENMIETSKSLIEVDTNIIATNWDIDYRVCEIEWTLEDMGGSSPVNFKLLKKGVGNMALSRYEQAKIMILGGVYEKETLTRQLDAYLKRKYVSQEEYDELIALMEARDMVTNK